MPAAKKILAIDQGTTSSRAIVFEPDGRIVAIAQQEFKQYYPQNGWVEHDPETLWQSSLDVCRQALAEQGNALEIAAIGIANQRETSIIWERATGKAVYNAIVWQDRRAAARCEALREQGYEARIAAKTGLRLDPYFSASKIDWLLEHIPGARARAEAGELAFGTVDAWLIWKLTGGRLHATDASNASRTMLFNIHTAEWDQELLEIFNIPRAILPRVYESAADFGVTAPGLFARQIPIAGVAGDQQAALIGQACLEPGMLKSTYGTGCFALLNTGSQAAPPSQQLLTTIAYRQNGETCYAVEGAIFVAGAAVQWLRDVKVIDSAAAIEPMLEQLPSNKGVYMAPAFTGLGAPYWQPHARGALFGLTRDTGAAELARAALESICYQSFDLLRAMASEGQTLSAARVDGGMARNDWLAAFLADILGIPVERPQITETTALGAACLAGLQLGIYSSLADLKQVWRPEKRFEPRISESQRARLLADWRRAIDALLHYHRPSA